jgi:hypothetical protein
MTIIRKRPDRSQNPSRNENIIDLLLGEHDYLGDENHLAPTGIDGLDLTSPTYEDLDFGDFIEDALSLDIFTAEAEIEFSISKDGCQVCFWVKLRVSIYQQATGWGACYTRKECRQPPEPPPLPPDYPPGVPAPPPVPKKGGLTKLIIKIENRSVSNSVCPEGKSSDLSKTPGTYTVTLGLTGTERWSVKKKSTTLKTEGKCKGGKNKFLFQTNTGYDLYLSRFDNFETNFIYKTSILIIQGKWGYISGSSGDIRVYTDVFYGSYPIGMESLGDFGDDETEDRYNPPPPPPENEDEMSCCRNSRDNEALLRKIAKAVGTQDFPVRLPKNYLNTINGSVTLNSIPQIQAHQFVNNDAVFGSFPLDIEIEDIDPETKGQQTKKIRIENLAEAIAELFVLSVKTSVDADNVLEGLLRLIPEILSVKAAGLITQSYSKANADFLGYRGNEKTHNISMNFETDIDQAANLKGLFKESNTAIKLWKNENKESLVDYLQRLMFAAGLVKAAFLHKDSSELTYSLEDEIANAEGSEDFKLTWDRFIELLNTNKVFNRSEGSPRPKARAVPFQNPDPS